MKLPLPNSTQAFILNFLVLSSSRLTSSRLTSSRLTSSRLTSILCISSHLYLKSSHLLKVPPLSLTRGHLFEAPAAKFHSSVHSEFLGFVFKSFEFDPLYFNSHIYRKSSHLLKARQSLSPEVTSLKHPPPNCTPALILRFFFTTSSVLCISSHTSYLKSSHLLKAHSPSSEVASLKRTRRQIPLKLYF